MSASQVLNPPTY